MQQDSSFLGQLKSNWMIIICIAGIISTWTLFSTRLTGAEAEIIDLKDVVHDINDIKTDIAVIQSQLAEQAKKDSAALNQINSASGKLDFIINAVSDTKKNR